MQANALSFAAHPELKPPWLQKLLLRRGMWEDPDYWQPGLHGVQFWNGDTEQFLKTGLRKWIELLLQGRQLTLVAGNDAHGSFNRFRQIGTPHISMSEHHNEVFGKVRNGVFMREPFSQKSLIEALQKGRVVVSDGPIVSFQLQQNEKTYKIGQTMSSQTALFSVDASSTPTFGELVSVTLVMGSIADKKETQRPLLQSLGLFQFTHEEVINELPALGYVRLEAVSQIDKRRYYCFTNPIYLKTA